MTAVVWPDVEGAVRGWLRADTALVEQLGGGRVFFQIPDKPSWPLVTVSRVGGGDDRSEAPVDIAFIQIDVYGTLDSHNRPKWRELTPLVNSVRSACSMLSTQHVDVDGTRLFGSNVLGVVRLADPDTGRPRYSITAEVTAICPQED